MRLLTVATVALTSLLIACESPRPACVTGRTCEVRAFESGDPIWAELVAHVVDDENPQVAELFSLPETNVLVEIRDELRLDGRYSGITFRRRRECTVSLGLVSFRSPDYLSSVVRHELAHVYLTSFDPVPTAVEEGLALYVEALLEPRGGLQQRLKESRKTGARLSEKLLDLTPEEESALTDEMRMEMEDAGLNFVDEVGFETLLDELREGTLTREKILALIEE